MIKLALPSCLLQLCASYSSAPQMSASDTKPRGFIDAQLNPISSQGGSEKGGKVFEKMRLKSEKSEDAGEDKGIDVPMEFLYDLNHVISLHLESADEPLHLVPTTRISDMVLMHDSCMQCMSYHDA